MKFFYSKKIFLQVTFFRFNIKLIHFDNKNNIKLYLFGIKLATQNVIIINKIKRKKIMEEQLNLQGGEHREAQPKTIMLLICFFLGWIGIHRLLMGYKNWWLMLITFGGCGIWTIIDFIMIVSDKLPMSDGTPLKKD